VSDDKYTISDQQEKWMRFCKEFGIRSGEFRIGADLLVVWRTEGANPVAVTVGVRLDKGAIPLLVDGIPHEWDSRGAEAIREYLTKWGIPYYLPAEPSTHPIWDTVDLVSGASATATRHPVKARYDLLTPAFLEGLFFGDDKWGLKKEPSFLPLYITRLYHPALNEKRDSASVEDRLAYLFSAARAIFYVWRSTGNTTSFAGGNAEYLFIDKLAMIADVGATKYGDRNWQKSRLEGDKSPVNHAIKHCFEYLKKEPNEYEPDGDCRTHLVQAVFNLMMEHFWLVRPEELKDTQTK
jgi:hypothetical protein